MRILVVEDFFLIAEEVRTGLESMGFSVDIAANITTAETMLQSADFDALILDRKLPDGDGIEWLKHMRLRGVVPPVLILSGRDALADRVDGLDAGADDYLAKPIAVAELAARLRAVLRRPGARRTALLVFGSLEFDSVSRVAKCHGHDLQLARREADLLEVLMRAPGHIAKRSVIENALYNFEEPVTPNALEAIVSRLRHKLALCGGERFLKTLRGFGYCLQIGKRHA